MGIPKKHVIAMLDLIEMFMPSVHYHTMQHVFETVNFLTKVFKSHQDVNLVRDAQVCMILHDVGHPGHTLSKTDLNQYASMEQFHATLAQWFVKHYEIPFDTNLLKESVEATNLADHAKWLKRFNVDSDLTRLSKIALLCKTADFCHFTFPWNVHVDKSIAIYREFGQSGTRHDLMLQIRQEQVDFIDKFVMPLIKTSLRLFPNCHGELETCLDQIIDNRYKWSQFI